MKIIAKLTLLLLFLVALSSCASSSKTTSTSTPTVSNPKPSWVKMRPIDRSSYIGIAVISKKYTPDYQAVAKKNALYDLASEIKVNINSSSILYSIEKNDRLKEEYLSNIKTSTSQSLEGYELIDNWEDDKEYWVYYKLNKLKHAEIQQRKKNAATSLAFDHYKNAKGYENDKNILLASSSFIQGLKALENYLGEENKVDFEGQSIDLGSKLSTDLQKMLSDISLSVSPSSLSVKRGFKKEYKCVVKATYKNNDAQDIPLAYHFITGKGDLNEGTFTNEKGVADLVVQKVSSELAHQEVGISIDNESLAKKANADDFMVHWIASLPSQDTKVALDVKNPILFVVSEEKNFGKNINKDLLKNEMQNLLAKEGFEFTQNLKNADMILSIDADTEKASANNGINVSYLHASFQVLSKTNQELSLIHI